MKRSFFLLISLWMCLPAMPAQVTIHLRRGRPIVADSIYRIQAGVLTYVADASLHDLWGRDISFVQLPGGTIQFDQMGNHRQHSPSPEPSEATNEPAGQSQVEPDPLLPAQGEEDLSAPDSLPLNSAPRWTRGQWNQAAQPAGTAYSFDRVRKNLRMLPPGYDAASWARQSPQAQKESIQFFVKTWFVQVKLQTGETLRGQFIHADEGGIELYLSPRPYAPHDPVERLWVRLPWIMLDLSEAKARQEGRIGGPQLVNSSEKLRRLFDLRVDSEAWRAYRAAIQQGAQTRQR